MVSRRGQIFFVVSRSSWSVVLLGRLGHSWWSVVLRGQLAFFLFVAVSLRGQSYFVVGVYILWWLCTRIY